MSGGTAEANLLGALAQAVADRTQQVVADVAGHPSAAAALAALYHFLDRPSLDDLRRVLGLTPSGTVRLVDRLAGAGLVSRGPGADGRSRTVSLTPSGRAQARRVERARADALEALLAGLPATDRRTLHDLLGRIMSNLVATKDGGAWTCRLCDLRACGRPQGRCPAANAAAVRYGPAAAG